MLLPEKVSKQCAEQLCLTPPDGVSPVVRVPWEMHVNNISPVFSFVVTSVTGVVGAHVS